VSAGTNVVYAIGRSPDPHQQLIWGALAIAAALMMSVLPSALVKSVKARSASASMLCLLGIAIFGAYSLASALGASTNVRLQAGSNASDAAAQRAELTKRRDKAEADLKMLAPSKPSTELDAEIAKLIASRKDLNPSGNGDCVGWLPGIKSREVCVEVSELRVELARAKKHEALEIEIRETSGALGKISSASTAANVDAMALQGYLTLVGLRLDIDDVNRLLVALTVAAIELGVVWRSS
jgi:hypothetical protein